MQTDFIPSMLRLFSSIPDDGCDGTSSKSAPENILNQHVVSFDIKLDRASFLICLAQPKRIPRTREKCQNLPRYPTNSRASGNNPYFLSKDDSWVYTSLCIFNLFHYCQAKNPLLLLGRVSKLRRSINRCLSWSWRSPTLEDSLPPHRQRTPS